MRQIGLESVWVALGRTLFPGLPVNLRSPLFGCGCSLAHFNHQLTTEHDFTCLLFVILFKIQKNDCLLWSSCFLKILRFGKVPIGVSLFIFHLFSLLKSIFKRISFWSFWNKQGPVEIDQKLIFKKIDLSKENK